MIKYKLKNATISDKIYFNVSDIVDSDLDTFRYVLFSYTIGDKTYYTLEYNKETGDCAVPSGSWYKLDIENLTDLRYSSDKHTWEFDGSLRPAQQEIIDKLLVNDRLYSSLIQAPCGFGKSYLGGYVIGQYKKSTIIICHTKLLAYQWHSLLKEKIKDTDIGFIGDSKESIKPITVAIYKSLTSRLDKVQDMFEVMVVDECLDYETAVVTKEGPMKIGVIVNNKKDVEVLSYNKDTNTFEYKKVYDWFKNPQKAPFIKLETSPRGAISCTKNHNIYTYDFEKGVIVKKPAEEIKIGDFLVCSKSEGKTSIIIKKECLPILLGLIIGDGSLEKNRKLVTRIGITQGEKQKKYLEYKTNIIKGLFDSSINSSKSGYQPNNNIYSINSNSFYDNFNLIKQLYSDTQKGSKNIISKEISELLTEDSWSLIYQDDGSISNGQITFSFCELNNESLDNLIISLKSLFNLEDPYIRTNKGYKYIRLKTNDSIKFLDKIKHRIHPELSYKNIYSDCVFTPIEIDNAIEPFSVKQVISITTKEPTYQNRYNISVEDNHNYCTSTALVGNCHLAPADTFSKVVNGINTKVKIGLTATPWRKDGLHVALPDYFGPNKLIAKDEDKLTPSVEIVKTSIPFKIINPARDWTRQLTKLSSNTSYVELIATKARDKVASGRCILILAERIEMLKELQKLIPRSVLLVGETKNRDHILDNMGKEYDAVLSTRIFDEGISCNRLDTLILTSPSNNPAKLEQRIGRIQREHPDKQYPLVIDMWLTGHIVMAQQNSRKEWYLRKNYNILS
jgi:superfamily II DNA or RNA helicase